MGQPAVLLSGVNTKICGDFQKLLRVLGLLAPKDAMPQVFGRLEIAVGRGVQKQGMRLDLGGRPLRVAIFSQHFDAFFPPSETSVGQCSRGLATALAKTCTVRVYGLGTGYGSNLSCSSITRSDGAMNVTERVGLALRVACVALLPCSTAGAKALR